ncbi:MAG TPA: OmpA family protein [Bryobacteraceae bacterium]|nr:OmpA family protein [Bryobacteraceae bacterium]
MKSKLISFAGAIALCILLSSCHKQTAAAKTPPAPHPAEMPATAAASEPSRPEPAREVVSNPSSTPDAATKERIQDLLDKMQDAYFDYNQHTLRPDAQAALQADAKELAEILKQYPDYKLTIQGYCDERGSEEYNLALGDARAKQAKDDLVTWGIPATQLRVVSYGKEKQVCDDHSETCWQKNRRVHITQDQQAS